MKMQINKWNDKLSTHSANVSNMLFERADNQLSYFNILCLLFIIGPKDIYCLQQIIFVTSIKMEITHAQTPLVTRTGVNPHWLTDLSARFHKHMISYLDVYTGYARKSSKSLPFKATCLQINLQTKKQPFVSSSCL